MVAHICSSRTLTDRRKMETGELLGALRPVSLMYASGDNRDPFSNKAEVRANVQNCSLISTCTHTHTHIITRKRHHGPHHQVPKELSAELGTRFITSQSPYKQARLSGVGAIPVQAPGSCKALCTHQADSFWPQHLVVVSSRCVSPQASSKQEFLD